MRYFAMGYMVLTTGNRRVFGELVFKSTRYPSKTQIMDTVHTNHDEIIGVVVTSHHEFESKEDYESYRS